MVKNNLLNLIHNQLQSLIIIKTLKNVSGFTRP